eukprot:64326_1
MAFNADYLFGRNNLVILVVLKHKKGKHLRIDPGNQEPLDENGGQGKWAQWNIELHGEQDGLKVVTLKHNASGKYLGIYGDGNTIDVGGGGGKWTRFKVHKTGNNSAKLESCELEAKYPAVQPGGPAIGGGRKWTEFEQRGGGPYGHEYFFGNENQVVLCGYQAMKTKQG